MCKFICRLVPLVPNTPQSSVKLRCECRKSTTRLPAPTRLCQLSTTVCHHANNAVLFYVSFTINIKFEEHIRRAQRAILTPNKSWKDFLDNEDEYGLVSELIFSNNCVPLQISGPGGGRSVISA
ncbi:hypothetical protein BYT27DRAFT_6744406 [Phlegmacium glaucopus]|nr:hypothetical protein BYT27DRAFT_6744406 [Phlegmacium glaucopus]